MIHYDPLQDRSEQAGWLKVPDQAVPTDAEQDLWAGITILTTVGICVLAVVIIT